MKTFLFTCLVLIGTTAAASTGMKAKSLFHSLLNAGAYADCGMGQCHVGATDLSCQMNGNSVNHRVYKCTFNTKDESGSEAPLSIQGKIAARLFSALVKSGAEGDCGMGTCTLEIDSVHCQRRNDVPPGESLSYQCELK